MIKISVVTAVYNRSDSIAQALAALFDLYPDSPEPVPILARFCRKPAVES
ncbi:MAG: hypothetical protein WA210_04460 [Burkholderiaceae bacterium]